MDNMDTEECIVKFKDGKYGIRKKVDGQYFYLLRYIEDSYAGKAYFNGWIQFDTLHSFKFAQKAIVMDASTVLKRWAERNMTEKDLIDYGEVIDVNDIKADLLIQKVTDDGKGKTVYNEGEFWNQNRPLVVPYPAPNTAPTKSDPLGQQGTYNITYSNNTLTTQTTQEEQK